MAKILRNSRAETQEITKRARELLIEGKKRTEVIDVLNNEGFSFAQGTKPIDYQGLIRLTRNMRGVHKAKRAYTRRMPTTRAVVTHTFSSTPVGVLTDPSLSDKQKLSMLSTYYNAVAQ